MVRSILRFGAPELQRPASAVPALASETQQLIDDLIETMYAAPGIGLAAPQLGVSARIAVVDLSVGRSATDLLVLVNPEIVERSGMQLEEEGCLSIPGFTASVLRPARIVVRGADRDGISRTVEGTGLLARALQHELDHLEGLLFIDRLRRIQRAVIAHHVRRLEHLGRW